MDGDGSKKARTVIDWEGIELAYRAGVKTLRDIGSEFGVSHTAIKKRAERDGWVRDLSAKIKAKADALVSKDAVSKEVSMETKIAEQEVVEANAELQARIRREQRKDISRSRKLVMSLLDELEEQTENIELYEQLGELLYAPDEKGSDKLNELYRKVISLGGRTSTMKQLAESLKTLVALEREAFGIDDRSSSAEKLVIVKNAKDMTDDELAAIAGRGGARTPDQA
jgi:hypothetical protein